MTQAAEDEPGCRGRELDRLETVLLACKAPATEETVRVLGYWLAWDGCVVSLQNGLDHGAAG